MAVRAYDSYKTMLRVGIAREVARMVLPVNIMSTCFVTCNPRSLMSFLSLRVESPTATYVSKPQREIQMLAEQYEHHFSRLYPLTWRAFNANGRVAP
jgi:thymidylate synthase (FAD)